MNSPWMDAGELLERHYRWLEIPEPVGTWQQACWLLLGRQSKTQQAKQRQAAKTDADTLWEETCLRTPEETAAASAAELIELFEQQKLPDKSVGPIRSLAQWWLENVSDVDPLLERIDDESLRQSLRSLKGLSAEQGDQLALYVFGRAVLPLNRATVRIGCRHRWIGWDGDDEEWQGWFRQVLRESDCTAQEFAGWMMQVGKEFCGPKPKCGGCPLESLLPASGPEEPLE